MKVFASLCGIFCIGAALLDWDWFFDNWRASFFVDVFGRGGARIFYGVLGIGLILASLSLTQFSVSGNQ
jgi:hypothetical protein